MNKILLHLEGVAILLLSLYFYSYNQFSWLLFFVLFISSRYINDRLFIQ
ncbi:hypothetical protein LR69_04640 [Geobacillus sp. BCO2]|nr:hypothetical protein LR69_04640 [Geobacillus sp. BCO2]